MHLCGEIISVARDYHRMFKDPWRRWGHGQGVRVAVIDGGVNRDLSLRRLQRRIVHTQDFASALGGNGDAQADRLAHVHGTVCASLVASVARRCEIVDCHITNTQRIDPCLLASAILWASTEGQAHVISISVGTKDMSQVERIRAACRMARTNGSVVVAACPNMPGLSIPSSLREVISVATMDLGRCGRWCCSSVVPNRIYCHGGPYKTSYCHNPDGIPIRGTSPATAVISGQIARLLSSFHVRCDDVYDRMCKYAAAIVQ